MKAANAEAGRWALLIGIDFYKSLPLQGAVRDAEDFSQRIERRYIITDIVLLTASTPTDANTVHPPENPDSLPTFENVTSRLERITANARDGDLVYIHFAGHGTQKKNSDNPTGDLALVLYDRMTGYRYLHGQHFANILKGMVDKGLLVTVVLDCCFSGGVVRDDHSKSFGLRTLPYDSRPDIAYPLTILDQADVSRDAHHKRNWLVNPTGYTILAACSPFEEAGEFEHEGTVHGALSSMLGLALDHYEQSGTRMAFQSLFWYIQSRFKSEYPKQSPVLYGNRGRCFFDRDVMGMDMIAPSIFQRDGRLYLEAGEAHGVHTGDQYELFSLNTSPSTRNLDNNLTEATVTSVRGLTSELEIVNNRSNEVPVYTGWRGRPRTYSTPSKIAVRFLDYDVDEYHQTAIHRETRVAPYVNGDEQQYPYLRVSLNNEGNYEFHDQSDQAIVAVPAVAAGDKAALYRVLEHLAIFKYFQQIKNKSPSLDFTAQLTDNSGKIIDSEACVDSNKSETVTLTICNHGKKDIYVALFNLGPLYQVKDLLDDEPFLAMPGSKSAHLKGKYPWEEKRIFMTTVPDYFKQDGIDMCLDEFKLFVTSRPTMFSQFLLPEITNVFRGPDERTREIPSNQRAVEVERSIQEQGYDPREGKWTTQSFYVRTTAKAQEA